MIPKVIKTEKQHQSTLRRIENIFDAKPGSQEADELELLVLLVEKYEDEEFPIDLPDPVTAIRFRMEQSNLQPKDLIPYIGSKGRVSEILNGRRELTLGMIRKLVNGLGIPAEVLLREPGANLDTSEWTKIGKRFPLNEMYKRGWFRGLVGSLQEAKEQIEDVLRKFVAPAGGSAKLVATHKRQKVRSGSAMDGPALIAWQIRVLSEASRQTLPIYQEGTVTAAFLSQVAKLSYFDNGPSLAKEFLQKSGIHFIVEKHLPKTYLDGAAMRVSDGSRLVALTLRHDRLDNFWFTLLHELAHVSLHLDTGDVDVIFDDLDKCSTDKVEKEADELAWESLIPAKSWGKATLLKHHSEDRVKSFAEQLRIHPAIPAGRIRHELDNHRLLGDLVGRGGVRRLFEPRS